MKNIWNYEERLKTRRSSILGYDVSATDGDIGKVSDESTEADAEHIVVDTGFWIFGKKRLIPAAAITDIDHDEEKVTLMFSKEQVEKAPDWDDDSVFEEEARRAHDDYYTSSLRYLGPIMH